VPIQKYRVKGKQVEFLHGPAAVMGRFPHSPLERSGKEWNSVNQSQKTYLLDAPNSTDDRGCKMLRILFFSSLLTLCQEALILMNMDRRKGWVP
jgi:hypothetical protein